MATRRRRTLFLVLVFLGTIGGPVSADAPHAAAPAFADFPAVVERIADPRIDLESHPKARRYRARLREALSTMPNFAGRYTIATWGCGSSCVAFAIVDPKSGKVYFPKQLSYVAWSAECVDHYGLEFRPDSSLLVVHGSPDEKADVATYYYKWANDSLTKVASIPECDPR